MSSVSLNIVNTVLPRASNHVAKNLEGAPSQMISSRGVILEK